MKLAVTIATYLLGIIFLVFGLNAFLNFIPLPKMTGDPATFIGLLFSTGYLVFVKIMEIVLAIMILVGYQRPLAFLLIAPIAVNIALFEIFIAHQPGMGIFLVLLVGFLIYANRDRYMPIVAK